MGNISQQNDMGSFGSFKMAADYILKKIINNILSTIYTCGRDCNALSFLFVTRNLPFRLETVIGALYILTILFKYDLKLLRAQWNDMFLLGSQFGVQCQNRRHKLTSCTIIYFICKDLGLLGLSQRNKGCLTSLFLRLFDFKRLQFCLLLSFKLKFHIVLWRSGERRCSVINNKQ